VITVNGLIRQVKQKIAHSKRQADIKAYLDGGRKPWSRGYKTSKFDFIQTVLKDNAFITKFRHSQALPTGYGYGYDERVVEYPWVLSRLSEEKGELLDAGSVLNFSQIIDYPILSGKTITIFTLAPEKNAFWEKGISYCYGDLRQIPFRDNWFDEIISISTLEHVGMDNRMYAGENAPVKVGLDADKAARELVRILKPSGKLLASVGFGKYQLIEWNDSPFAVQFDSPSLRDLLKEFESCAAVSTSFYKYTQDGWNISTEKDCQNAEYFNIHTANSIDFDNAAAARAVVLIEVVK
jgi:SAM-dependent methyltransferase